MILDSLIICGRNKEWQTSRQGGYWVNKEGKLIFFCLYKHASIFKMAWKSQISANIIDVYTVNFMYDKML